MAKYSIVELTIKNGVLCGIDHLSRNAQKALRLNNAIYIYRGIQSQKVYIGQTIHFIDRHKQHFNGAEEKFNTADFTHVMIIFSKYFNGSALDDVESQLITYFSADNPRLRKRTISFDTDEVINRTGGNSVNDYADREKVALEVILPFMGKGTLSQRLGINAHPKRTSHKSPCKIQPYQSAYCRTR